jgi:D-hydroxyproline dehydrogenase subunit gamma
VNASVRPSRPDAQVTIVVDGRECRVTAGTSVAAALLGLGVHAFRRSVRGEPRAPLCGMGICFECRVAIDGVAHRRACLVPVVDGLLVNTAEPDA